MCLISRLMPHLQHSSNKHFRLHISASSPSQICETAFWLGEAISKQTVSSYMRRWDLLTRLGNRGSVWSRREGCDWFSIRLRYCRWLRFLRRSPPLGSAPARPLFGLSCWMAGWYGLSAKSNVYTNTHNCSVRSHGELMTLRRGASRALLWLQWRQVLGAAVRNYWKGTGEEGGRAGWDLNWPSGSTFGCHVWN